MSPQSARTDSTTQSPSTTRSRVQTKPNSETQSSTSSSVVEPPDARSSQGPSKTADVRSNDVHSNELRSHHADDSQLHDKESDTISDSISIDQTKSESGVKLPADANTAMSDPSSQLAWANQHSATASAMTLLTPTATVNQHFLGFENANAGSTASFAASNRPAQETPNPQLQNTTSDANRSGSNDALRDKLAAANHPNVANVNTRVPKLSPDHPNTTASSDIFDAPLSSSPLVFANNLPASKKWLQTITTPGRALDPLEASQLSRQISSLNYLDPVTGYSQSDSS